MIYGKLYIVPIYPHMISVADDNKYEIDDILLDKLAVISNMSANVGEITGPLFSGIVNDMIGVEKSCAILAGASFLYGILFFFVEGMLFMCKKDKVRGTMLKSYGMIKEALLRRVSLN